MSSHPCLYYSILFTGSVYSQVDFQRSDAFYIEKIYNVCKAAFSDQMKYNGGLNKVHSMDVKIFDKVLLFRCVCCLDSRNKLLVLSALYEKKNLTIFQK